MALYERADMSVARDLFEWAYERSVKTYRAVKQSMQEPDPFRMRLRAALSQAICTVVAEHKTTTQAIDELALAAEEIEPFRRMLERELAQLTEYNFARYGLRFAQLKTWLENTRPRT
ncbi:MAG: hypothetical protein JWP36_1435 [Paucimonas sp.]|nr:hypothetical protein [Paucimonas sp.]